jgi:hypothetical protein
LTGLDDNNKMINETRVEAQASKVAT